LKQERRSFKNAYALTALAILVNIAAGVLLGLAGRTLDGKKTKPHRIPPYRLTGIDMPRRNR
jgi:hypothetical protein